MRAPFVGFCSNSFFFLLIYLSVFGHLVSVMCCCCCFLLVILCMSQTSILSQTCSICNYAVKPVYLRTKMIMAASDKSKLNEKPLGQISFKQTKSNDRQEWDLVVFWMVNANANASYYATHNGNIFWKVLGHSFLLIIMICKFSIVIVEFISNALFCMKLDNGLCVMPLISFQCFRPFLCFFFFVERILNSNHSFIEY